MPGSSTDKFGKLFLEALKNHYFRVCNQAVEDPRNAGWHALAYRAVLKHHFPTRVYLGTINGRTVAWVLARSRTKRWQVEDVATVPTVIVNAVQPDGWGGAGSDDVLCWMQEPSDPVFSMALPQDLRNHLDYWLSPAVQALVDHWAHQRRAAFQTIGQRPWTLRLPDNPVADPRMGAVAGPRGPATFETVVGTAHDGWPLACVPDDVASVMERCLRLWVWGYQEWDFFTVSEHYAGLALDTSLRALYLRSFAYPAHVRFEDQTGEVVSEVTWQKPEPAWLRFNPDKQSPSFRGRIYINDTLLDLRKHALVKWANSQQWLSPGEVWIMSCQVV